MPSRADVKKAVSLFRGQAEYEYFFSRLSSAAWIEPLLEEGRFSAPPQAISDGEYLRFPLWPESAYLARVARANPAQAARVLREVGETNNPRVHLDLAQVALQVDAADAAEWAERERKWVASQDALIFSLPEKLAELAAFCAANGQLESALALAASLFEVLPDARWGLRAEKDASEFRLPPEPRAKYDAWDYSRASEIALPSLVEHGGGPALLLFTSLLETAIRLSRNEPDAAPPLDYSFIWHDAIESDDPMETDVRGVLIRMVRDIGIAVARRDGLPVTIELFEAQKWDLFRRLAIHVARVVAGPGSAAVRDLLVNREAFMDVATHHEYALMLQEAFGFLSPKDQLDVLGWISEGPDRTAMKERHRAFANTELSEETEKAWVEHWQRDRLSPIRDSLPTEWRQKFNDLVKRHGPPVFDFSHRRTSAGARGEPTPISAEELGKLGNDGVRQFLRDWHPEGGFDKPSRHGLALSLASLGDDFFEREAHVAEEWKELHPSYVSAFLEGIQRAQAAGRAIPWRSVLELCEAVSSSQGETLESKWLRQSVATLITKRLDDEASPFPEEGAPRVWSVIERLIASSANELATQSPASADSDYLTAAINSARGKAVEAAIRFAIWRKKATDAQGRKGWTLEEREPVVSEALTDLLRPRENESPVSRAVFGLQFGPLLWLDEGWVSGRLELFFPSQPEFAVHRDAVWLSYIRYSQPFPTAIELLRGEYGRAVDALRGKPTPDERGRERDRHVADHLMVYYWLGRLELGKDDQLVERFFANADLKLRSHAWDFVGRSLRTDEKIPVEHIRRLMQLCEWRLSAIERIESPGARKAEVVEAEPFGWWFACDQFPPDWAIGQLIRILKLGAIAEPDHMVAERLAALVGTYPSEVADAISRVVDAANESYVVGGWRDEAKKILKELLGSPDALIRGKAESTIHALGALGLDEFRGLLRAEK